MLHTLCRMVIMANIAHLDMVPTVAADRDRHTSVHKHHLPLVMFPLTPGDPVEDHRMG